MTKELIGVAIVTVGITDSNGEDVQRKCVVPANWLWSPVGLADTFRMLQEGWLGPRESADEDVWDSFHVVAMEESTEFLMLEEKAALTGTEKSEVA